MTGLVVSIRQADEKLEMPPILQENQDDPAVLRRTPQNVALGCLEYAIAAPVAVLVVGAAAHPWPRRDLPRARERKRVPVVLSQKRRLPADTSSAAACAAGCASPDLFGSGRCAGE
jgi:hypothetical protein